MASVRQIGTAKPEMCGDHDGLMACSQQGGRGGGGGGTTRTVLYVRFARRTVVRRPLQAVGWCLERFTEP